MNQVIRPHVPYCGPIPEGLHDGKLIEIKGYVPYGSDRFAVNLVTGPDPNSDHALHVSVKFPEQAVVRNAFHQCSWGNEEMHGDVFPFAIGRGFTLLILVDTDAYRMSVDNQHCWEFHHRIPFSTVSSIYIDGMVQVDRIEYIKKHSPCTSPGIYPDIPGHPAGTGGQIAQGVQPAVCVPPAPPEKTSGKLAPVYNPGVQPAVCVPPAPPEKKSGKLAPVYNPPIPYAYPIYGGLKVGMVIHISGRPSANPHKFTISFKTGTAPHPPPDIGFHFDARFFNNTVALNSRNSNVWRKEEVKNYIPFQPATNFDIIIKIKWTQYRVSVNGQHFCAYNYRVGAYHSSYDTLYIEDDIIVSTIKIE